MRTPRLFLEIFALAMILPLLLACGGSDEPTDGPSPEQATSKPKDLPDSVRATADPEGRTSSGQTATAPTTEGTEPSPEPRATAQSTPATIAAPTRQVILPTNIPRPTVAPPPESEMDREALVALYNATGDPNWYSTDNWLSDVPISEWFGVTTDDNGRVTVLGFLGNRLSAEIPPELGNLAMLEDLYLDTNQLSGEIPQELGNLINLEYLGLRGNQLSGCVPSSLAGRLNEYFLDDLGDLWFCR